MDQRYIENNFPVTEVSGTYRIREILSMPALEATKKDKIKTTLERNYIDKILLCSNFIKNFP
ncbi:MAG: hypothetical protein FGO69_08410 [Methanobacterium sp.]|nr:MAG: hypothetical protein FGO69_08410 [Methanobacterium sp.]